MLHAKLKSPCAGPFVPSLVSLLLDPKRDAILEDEDGVTKGICFLHVTE